VLTSGLQTVDSVCAALDDQPRSARRSSPPWEAVALRNSKT